MLQEIRERTQGWIAWAIIILITIPFALWGIQSYFGVGDEPYAAKVNGVEIKERELTQSIQRARLELRERMGDAYDPRQFEGTQLRGQVLDRLIEDALLLGEARRMGLRVADETVRAAILNEPVFQQNGRFDKTIYERVLQLQGLTPAIYEASLRQRLLAAQLERTLFGTAFAIDSEVASATRLLNQKRDLAYLRLARGEFMPSDPPSEERLRAFYEQNSALFTTPEQVRIAYVLLAPDSAAPNLTVTEDMLRARYEERLNEFKVPEKRRVRHILLTLPPDADEATAERTRARLFAIRQRIVEGADFAALATENSEDSISAARGGDLGELAPGTMDPEFERAAFAVAQGEVSAPVRTRFGYHLIQATEVVPARTRPFDEVREQLTNELRTNAAEAAFFDQAERLATLTYETPDSLIPAAEELGLEIQRSEWFGRAGGTDLLAHPKVIAAAFSDEVLGRGHNSELIEPDPERPRALVLRVDEHRPETQRPFDEVRDEIVAALKERDATDAARAAAKAMIEQLQQGEQNVTLDMVAAGRAIERPGLVERNAATVPATVARLAFDLPRPAAGQARYGSGDWDGDVVVVAVMSVVDGQTDNEVSATQRTFERSLLADALAHADFRNLMRDLVARARIERKSAAVDRESGF